MLQSFQLGVVKHSQSDSQQQVRTNLDMKLIRKNLGMKLTFYMWLGVHKYIYLIQSIYMDMGKHTWPSKTNSQY